jgi:hypothetical protein
MLYTVTFFSISPLFSDDDSPKFDFDLPKYDFLSSGSPSNVTTDACDEGIEKEMLDIAIERSLQSEECSKEKESVF